MRRVIVARVLVVAACVAGLGVHGVSAGAPGDELPEAARKLWLEGKYFVVQKRFDEAIDRLDLVLRLAPDFGPAAQMLKEAQAERDRSEAHFRRADELMKRQDWDPAVQQADAALAVYPKHPKAGALLEQIRGAAAEAYRLAGEGLLAKDDLDGAGRAFRRALSYVAGHSATRRAMAGLMRRRGEAMAGDGRWGAALVFHMAEAEFAGADDTPGMVEARRRLAERMRFAVAPEPADPASAPSATDTAVQAAAWDRLAAEAPDFLDVQRRPGEAAPTYAVAIGVAEPDIEAGLVRSEQRVHEYLVEHEEPNPEVERLRMLLAVEVERLAQLQRERDRPCPRCGGSGWARCPVCYGTGIDPANPALPCPLCSSRWGARPGWLRCARCGGTGCDSRVSEAEIMQQESRVRQLEAHLAREPMTIVRRVPAVWQYTLEHHRKTGTLESRVRVTDTGAGLVILDDALRESAEHADTAVQNANPAIGLQADGLDLPSDQVVRKTLVSGAAERIATRVWQAVLESRARQRQDEAARLEAEGRAEDAVEAAVEAALLVAALDPQAAARNFQGIRERLAGG